MVNALRATRKAVVTLSMGVAALLLVAMVSSVFLQVVFRYVLAHPLSWAEELARYLFVWISMLGAGATIAASLDQGVDLLVKKFPARVQAWVDVFARLATVAFCLLLIVKGAELTGIVHMQTSPAMGIPMSLVYSAVPIGAGIMVLLLGLDALISAYGAARK